MTKTDYEIPNEIHTLLWKCCDKNYIYIYIYIYKKSEKEKKDNALIDMNQYRD